MSKEELFNLEYEFVSLIDFNLNIDEKEFYKYQDYLNNKILIKKLDGLIEWNFCIGWNIIDFNMRKPYI